MSETTTHRKRVTASDFPKREIKLDVVEPTTAPALPYWALATVLAPLALWFALPAHGALWAAVAATVLWLALAFMLRTERRRKDPDVNREIVLNIIQGGVMGLAAGCWAFVITRVIAG